MFDVGQLLEIAAEPGDGADSSGSEKESVCEAMGRQRLKGPGDFGCDNEAGQVVVCDRGMAHNPAG